MVQLHPLHHPNAAPAVRGIGNRDAIEPKHFLNCIISRIRYSAVVDILESTKPHLCSEKALFNGTERC